MRSLFNCFDFLPQRKIRRRISQEAKSKADQLELGEEAETTHIQTNSVPLASAETSNAVDKVIAPQAERINRVEFHLPVATAKHTLEGQAEKGKEVSVAEDNTTHSEDAGRRCHSPEPQFPEDLSSETGEQQLHAISAIQVRKSGEAELNIEQDKDHPVIPIGNRDRVDGPKITVRQPTLIPSKQGQEELGHPSPDTLAAPLSRKSSGSSSNRSRADSNGSLKKAHWLKSKLDEARVECQRPAHSYIVPRSIQDGLITTHVVAEDIRARNPDIEMPVAVEYATRACQDAVRLYAILAYIKKGADICSLLDEGVTDSDLPLIRTPCERSRFALRHRDGREIRTMMTWMDKHLENFDRFQWWMIAPVFTKGSHHTLDSKTVLPFIHFENMSDDSTRDQGGYSEVYPVRIHPAHHKFWPEVESEGKADLVAVKRLFSSEREEFDKEVEILTTLGQKNHPHLIQLLATYEQDKRFHLLFPYADSNLQKYWDTHPSPSFDDTTVLWSLRQMTGIAQGLTVIHNFKPTHRHPVSGVDDVEGVELKVTEGEQYFGRHGDIKPENILWFSSSQRSPDPLGVLQIADFGLGRFHGRDSRSRVNPYDVKSSPTYEPPECRLHRPVAREYDIWSLGCLYLEFITWLLKGSAQIEGFADFRGRQATGTGINDDNFFTIVEGKAVVRETVVNWSDILQEDEKCSQLMHDILDFIMKDLLKIESSDRCKASWLCHRFTMFLERAEKDADYMLKPVPRQRPSTGNRTNSAPMNLYPTASKTKRHSAASIVEQTTTAPAFAANMKADHSKPKDLVLRSQNTPNFPAAFVPRYADSTTRGANPTWRSV